VAGDNFQVGFEVSGGKSGTFGGIDSSVSWMEGRPVIRILVGPILKQERAGEEEEAMHRGEMRLTL
jgi:hypothetical protein